MDLEVSQFGYFGLAGLHLGSGKIVDDYLSLRLKNSSKSSIVFHLHFIYDPQKYFSGKFSDGNRQQF
jgi:hypothetical protein